MSLCFWYLDLCVTIIFTSISLHLKSSLHLYLYIYIFTFASLQVYYSALQWWTPAWLRESSHLRWNTGLSQNLSCHTDLSQNLSRSISNRPVHFGMAINMPTTPSLIIWAYYADVKYTHNPKNMYKPDDNAVTDWGRCYSCTDACASKKQKRR